MQTLFKCEVVGHYLIIISTTMYLFTVNKHDVWIKYFNLCFQLFLEVENLMVPFHDKNKYNPGGGGAIL